MTVPVLALLEVGVVVVVAGRTRPQLVGMGEVVAMTDVRLLMATVPVATGKTIETAAPDASTTRTAGTDRLRLRDVDPRWMIILPRVDGMMIRTDVIMAPLRSRMLTADLMIAPPEISLPGMADTVPVRAAILAMTTDEVVAVEVTGN